MNWYCSQNALNSHLIQVTIYTESGPLSYCEVLQFWQHEPSFRQFFTQLLSNTPFTAFRWETPPVMTDTVKQPFEFVLWDSPALNRFPDAVTFSDYFKSNAAVVEFFNLGRDAYLIVPCPQGDHSAYTHLGAFVRQAPDSQCHALWTAISSALQQRLTDHPIWLSTAGAGVAWLHVRLDDQPKYYSYQPYCRSFRR